MCVRAAACRQVFEEFLGGGIILESNGPKWHRDRMLLKPAFTFQRLQVLAQTTAERANVLCERVAAVALPSTAGASPPGGGEARTGRINMEPEFLNLTFDMACCIACVTHTHRREGRPGHSRRAVRRHVLTRRRLRD